MLVLAAVQLISVYNTAIVWFLFSQILNCIGVEAKDIETVKASIYDEKKQASADTVAIWCNIIVVVSKYIYNVTVCLF